MTYVTPENLSFTDVSLVSFASYNGHYVNLKMTKELTNRNISV